jgi:biotin operon repressor
MAKMKVDPSALQQFLDAGHCQADAARHFGVSEAAIAQRVKKLRVLGTRVVALEKAGQLVDEKLNASSRLERIQGVIDGELSWAVQEARRDGADRAALQDVILRLAGEVRQQLGLQLAISRALVDLRVVKEFQDTVTETIREVSPETARRIVERLKERRALRPSAALPTLDGQGSDGALA